MRAILRVCLIAILAGIGSTGVALADASGGIRCAAASSKVEKAVCADKGLMSADQWLAKVYQERLAGGTAQEDDALRASQRSWIKSRDSDCPNRDRAYLGAMGKCLHSRYYHRIQTLEEPLVRFADLQNQAPDVRNVCEAVRFLNKGERWRSVLRQALPVEKIRVPDKQDGPVYRKKTILKPALDAATTGASESLLLTNNWDGQPSRVQLYPGKPKNWIFTFYAGSSTQPSIFIFGSTPDGSRANNFIGNIYEEGSGYFDTHYVRFRGEPFAAITKEDRGGFSLLTLTGKWVDCGEKVRHPRT